MIFWTKRRTAEMCPIGSCKPSAINYVVCDVPDCGPSRGSLKEIGGFGFKSSGVWTNLGVDRSDWRTSTVKIWTILWAFAFFKFEGAELTVTLDLSKLVRRGLVKVLYPGTLSN
jgi:hypothetical protein